MLWRSFEAGVILDVGLGEKDPVEHLSCLVVVRPDFAALMPQLDSTER